MRQKHIHREKKIHSPQNDFQHQHQHHLCAHIK